MTNHITKVSNVTVGGHTSAAILSVTQKIATDKGDDFITPRTVQNTVPPVGVIHNHKWWEITVEFDEEEQTLLFITPFYIGSSETALGEGAKLDTTLSIEEYKEDGVLKRTISYADVYVKDWGNKITNNEDHQPVSVTFLSYGTRTVTPWAS